MGQLTTLAPAPALPPKASFPFKADPEKMSQSFVPLDYPSGNVAMNQSRPLMQVEVQQQQRPSLPQSSAIMQNIGSGRSNNIHANIMSHHNNNVVPVPPSLVVSDSSNQITNPFQIGNQEVSSGSDLTHMNVTNMNMGVLTPVIPTSGMHLQMNGVHNMMLSNARVQTHLPPIGLLPQTPHHPVAEFLYQLTKMLTDDNSQVIEWTTGRICVHDPQKLADTVLHKYFRHSKYASFQRQLNYFGFRKIAGKGKMSPCSYVNDAATLDLRSLLFIKRKTSSSSTKENSDKSRDAEDAKRSETSPTASIDSCSGKKRSLEYVVDQESTNTQPDLKKIPTLNSNFMNLTSAPPSKAGANPLLPHSETMPNKVHFQLQDQQILPISQVPVQIIPRTTILQNPLQAQQVVVAPSQPQSGAKLPNQNLNSSKKVAHFQFNEQLHFPSEKSLAMLTRPNYGTHTQMVSPSIVSSTPSLLGSEDSYPATMNELNGTNLNTPFDSSMGLWKKKDGERQALQGVCEPPELSSFQNSDGILPSWDALFPDSVNFQNPFYPLTNNVTDIEGNSATSEGTNTNSMLSRNSSLVDLAMLPTLCMLETNHSDGVKSEPSSYDFDSAVNKIGGSVIG